MSAIPPSRQIPLTQVPGAPTWFTPFLIALNQILGPLYDIANGGTTVGDNIPATYRTLRVSGPLPAAPLTFQHGLPNNRTPQECTIVQCTRVSGTPAGTNIAIVLNQWSVSGSTLTLNELVGIQSGCTYDIKFKVA